MKMYALLSDQGTACHETALCEECYADEENQGYAREQGSQADDIPAPNNFEDCGNPLDDGNDALSCCTCGWPDIDESNLDESNDFSEY